MIDRDILYLQTDQDQVSPIYNVEGISEFLYNEFLKFNSDIDVQIGILSVQSS